MKNQEVENWLRKHPYKGKTILCAPLKRTVYVWFGSAADGTFYVGNDLMDSCEAYGPSLNEAIEKRIKRDKGV